MFIRCVSLRLRADTVTEYWRASKYNPCTLAPEDCSVDGAESLGDASAVIGSRARSLAGRGSVGARDGCVRRHT
jgi:hypothetical protein